MNVAGRVRGEGKTGIVSRIEGLPWAYGSLGLTRLDANRRSRILQDLRSSSICAALASMELQRLANAAYIQFFPREATLVAQGDPLDGLTVLLAGQVKEHYLTEEGRTITLAIRGPGDLVGLPALGHEPSITSAIALKAVEALVVPGLMLRELLPHSPRLIAALISTLFERLRAVEMERIELVTCGSTVRLSRRLLELAERWGEPIEGGIQIPLALSQADLAARAGLSRESAVRSLQELRRRGLIRTRRRCIEIVDLAGLRKRARR